MKSKGPVRNATAIAVASAIAMTSLPIGVAQAGLIPTDAMVHQGDAKKARTQVQQLLSRTDVIAQMRTLGVDPAEAARRVNALSDAEVTKLAGRLQEMPAGQGAVGALIGAALIVFIILLVTDIIGWTDVFPFVKKH